MPAFSPLVLTDNSVTPAVNHTYSPTSNASGNAMFTDRANDLVALWPKLSAKVLPATAANKRSDATTTMSFPTTPKTMEGCCTLEAPTFSTFETRVKIASDTTAAERASDIALYRAWVASAAFAAFVNGESFY